MSGQNGKGSNRRWGNEAAVRDSWDSIFPPRQTSQQWCETLNLFTLTREGWIGQSWDERITEGEFRRRLALSTIMHRTEEPQAPKPTISS